MDYGTEILDASLTELGMLMEDEDGDGELGFVDTLFIGLETSGLA